MPDVSVQRLFDDTQEKNGLVWLTDGSGKDRIVPVGSLTDKNIGTIAHLNLTHPHRFQVLGQMELTYLRSLRKEQLADALNRLFSDNLTAIFIAENSEVFEPLKDMAVNKQVALLGCSLSSADLINNLNYYLSQELAEETTVHGVFMVILEVGVLITGDSAVGKSELALELISRGHGFVADDAVDLYKIGPETIQGKCPPMLKDFLEVRGLGLINIRSIFGETAVRPRKNLKLIVHLERPPGGDLSAFERLPSHTPTHSILGLDIPKVVLPVAVGRNLAVLVEAATRNFILMQRGINSTQQFLDRQKEHMNIEHLVHKQPDN
ncbi:MAG: HPr kinase/phosphorylase [Ferrovum sp. 37-45-19]|jgi:HPr kinase/phosphorylase|uniref:HPr(Ser) kinase/phosphatase n=1 Tax=Ferrovum sp. JA12 TaxID=1356299 RepID=UPI000702CC1E|nr:HPr(Ser) kinase/phosphatase [Ferrovum sp. JA12]OYV79602.1 MAG: HPr kinase/phosphorylase [Ferrovum sp. 21-44-67]OYV94603.1 MAG: HPr kinase/phosphorylase [Ferrovum sp. 37-45-19]OZB34570.1 MAG: HPr kinase/phosphorylase [Ferrovum sp. 34-44-207]HQT81527.1 HPr(Ser) kinase/phosphatase [Ferrovaceae bacterium]KRH79499.1 HPr kinase/phosphorylase [Ferrovum sp. JA12]